MSLFPLTPYFQLSPQPTHDFCPSSTWHQLSDWHKLAWRCSHVVLSVHVNLRIWRLGSRNIKGFVVAVVVGERSAGELFPLFFLPSASCQAPASLSHSSVYPERRRGRKAKIGRAGTYNRWAFLKNIPFAQWIKELKLRRKRNRAWILIWKSWLTLNRIIIIKK